MPDSLPNAEAAAPAPRRAPRGRLARLCRKELREILRDRRTIVTLVLMPLLVYPLLSITFQKVFLQSLSADGQVEYIIGVHPQVDDGKIEQLLIRGQQWLSKTEPGRDSIDLQLPTGAFPPLAPQGTANQPRLSMRVDSGVQQLLNDGLIDVAIVPPQKPDEESQHGSPPGQNSSLPAQIDSPPARDDAPPAARPASTAPFRLLYRESEPLSRAAAEFIERRLRAANDRYLHEELAQHLVDVKPPAQFESVSLNEPTSFYWLTTMIPLVLILMTITGAVYPAIDLTAGERERGTLETLMAAPVPRGELLLAKYVAVLAVALLTAVANLTAMTITLSVGGLSALLFGAGGFSVATMALVFALTVLFAAFFSAVVLALTSFARSFKEAQAYLIPLMLLCLTPGVLSLMPGLELTPSLAIVPLVNIVLLARDVLAGEAAAVPAVVSVVSTLFYALAAIGVAARVFGSDAVLYGSQSSWSDLLRRPAMPRDAGTLPGALLCLALLFPCTYLASGLLGKMHWIELQTALSGVATLLVYGALPGLFLYMQRVQATPAFRAYMPRPEALAAAVLLGMSLWPLAHEAFLLGEWLGLGGVNVEKLKFAQQLLERWRTVSPLLILISYALIPAMCEEWFFRGYLFSALLKSSGPLAAVLVSAVLFGVFHVVASSVLATERFLPTFLLGLVLGVVGWRSGSVLPGVVLHMVHNGLLLTISIYSGQLTAWGLGTEQQTHLPYPWLIASAILSTAGLALLFLSRPSAAFRAAQADAALQRAGHEELETSSSA